MRRWPLLGCALAVLWLFVRGATPANALPELVIGLAVGFPVAYAFRRFYRSTISVPRALGSVPAAVVYVVLFVWELLTANLDVAYRVLAPSLPIRPRVIELPLRVQSDLAITTIANSITLTPGTLTMDYDEDRNLLYVHAIAGEDREAVVAPIRRWEDYALRIFDEERAPDDPVPDVPLGVAASDRESTAPESGTAASGEGGDADGE